MKADIIVKKSGLLTTIQDQGRYGYQDYGIPVAGVMDKYAYQIANLLVGNKFKEPILEITLLGPTLKFNCKCRVAVTGADLGLEINGKVKENWSSFLINPGDEMNFSEYKSGCRAYLAIAGGLEGEQILSSYSTYLRGEFGGYQGRKLRIGDGLNLKDHTKAKFDGYLKLPTQYIPKYNTETEIRVIRGVQEELFSKQQLDKFYNNQYQISNQADRMGYRLDGSKLEVTTGTDIISEGISLGAIQISSEGKPMIMMADRQTVGGYAKIANVISVDLPYLAQLKPKDKISFSKITVQKAQKLYQNQQQEINKLKSQIERIYLIHGKN